jgi:HAD superfamily hydrolase (TIGR01490 family)
VALDRRRSLGLLLFRYLLYMQKPVAFFDVDGTLFRSSLLIELVEELCREGVFPTDAQTGFARAHAAWLAREGTYDAYIDAVIQTFMMHIKGVHYGQLADIGRRVVALKSKRVYTFTRDYVQKLKTEGYMVIAISQSPKTVLDEFCRQYGFDKVYGRMYEIGPTDCFTGVVTDEHLISNKSNIVNRVFERHPELTRAGSIAVGDTDGDIPLLESVDRPICFNPNQTLLDHAKSQGWEIVVERKDVVYHL